MGRSSFCSDYLHDVRRCVCGVSVESGKVLVEVDPRYFRPTEVELLIGNPTKAHNKLGWRHETSWSELCAEMVREDLAAVAREQRRHVD